jgi:hypothetical protein
MLLREVQKYGVMLGGSALPSGSEAPTGGQPYELAEGSDALLILTEWNEFKNLDLADPRSHAHC